MIWVVAAFAGPPPQLAAKATATWRAELDESAMAAVIDKAVNTAASQFPWVFRGIAKSKLRPAAKFCPRVAIQATETSWSANCLGSDRGFERDWAPGPQPFVSPEGQSVQSFLSHAADTITVRFEGGNGSRTTTYDFDGDVLIVSVTVEGKQLPKPMTWSFRYRREG